jgi:hypothetical protein
LLNKEYRSGLLYLILLNNEPISVPKFISAQKLLEAKFVLPYSINDDDKNKKRKSKATDLFTNT